MCVLALFGVESEHFTVIIIAILPRQDEPCASCYIRTCFILLFPCHLLSKINKYVCMCVCINLPYNMDATDTVECSDATAPYVVVVVVATTTAAAILYYYTTTTSFIMVVATSAKYMLCICLCL